MASELTNPPQAVSPSARQAAKVKTYVNQQLEKTRKQVKTVDLIAGGLVLIAFVLGFLLLAALVDGWIWPLSHGARWACLLFLVAGCTAYTLVSIVPLLLKRINPDYAAKMIEEAKPSFQNSILNYVSLRKRPEAIKPAVFDAVSRQAAANLATVPEDATVDRTKLIRLGFVLVGLTLFAVGYKMFSPKDPLQTVARIAYPSGKISKPAVVKIADVDPGDAKVFFGDSLKVTATVRGSHDPEDVRIVYSTLDGQYVDQSLLMSPESNSSRYGGELSVGGAGIQQSLRYQVVARDGVSPEYEVTVQPNPAITIESLVLQPPAYTKMKQRTLLGQGDIDAIEGTKVTVHAVANLSIKLAYIELLNEVRDPNQPASELDYDARYRPATTPIEMQSEGTSATGKFQITLNSNRDRPIATHYRIRFVSTDDDRNARPNVYPIQVIPDLAPEIRFRNPDQREVEIPVNGTFPILIDANDLDFEIKSVSLNIDHQGSRLLEQKLELSSDDGNRRVQASFRLSPGDLGLQVGDTAIFFASAADSRMSPYSEQPDPNISYTEKYSFKVIAADESAEKKDPNRQDPQDGKDQNKTDEPEKGEAGEEGDQGEDGGQGKDGDSGKDGSESGENEPQEGSRKPDDSSGSEDDSNKGEQSKDPGKSGTEPDSAGAKNDEPNAGKQKPEEPGENDPPKQGENEKQQGDPESGDPESGGSGTGKPEQQPDQDPEAGGQGSENSGSGESSEAQNESPNGEGGTGADSNGDSTSNEGGGSSSKDPGQGDPQGNQNSSGGQNDNGGDGQKDDSLTSGAEESVSDNASESELIRKMQEHFDNQQNESSGQQQPNQSQQNSESTPESNNDPADSGADSGAKDQTNGELGNASENPGQSNQPGDNATGGSPENPGGQQNDSPNQGSESSSDKGSDQQPSQDSGSKNGESDANDTGNGNPKDDPAGKGQSKDDPTPDEPGKGESGKGEPGAGESGKGESGKGESGKGESGKGESGKGESGQEDSGNAEGGDPGSGESGTGESGEGQFGKGDSGKGGSGEGESGTGETAEGDPGGANSNEGGGNATSSESSNDQNPGGETSSSSGDQQGGNQPGSAASGTNPGAGSGDRLSSPGGKQPGGTGQGVSSAEGEQLKREKANLEHAKKATDMILSKLSEQKNDPDPELLRKLKMSKEDLNKFLKRWDEMKRKAESGNVAAQQKYERQLKSLGLKPESDRSSVAQNQDKVEGLNQDGAVNEPPPELVPDFNSFLRDLSRVRDDK